MMTMLNFKKHRCAAISLMEVLTTVAVVGILGATAIVSYDGIRETTMDVIARNTVESLNSGVKTYSQLRSKDILSVPADDSSTAEEKDILMALQWEDPDDPEAGAPFFRRDYMPEYSSDTKDYRIVWTGSNFALRVPGEAGAGIKMDFGGGDIGKENVTYEDGYSPLADY